MPLSLTRLLHYINGKFRTQHTTQAAGDAASSLAYLRRVIALGVEETGYFQDIPRAVGHTQLAALAALDDEVDFAVRHHDALLIEGFTPKFHGFLLL
jgi:hypothetical protein